MRQKQIIDFSLDKSSSPLNVEPSRNNYHEIWNSGDKPAAFLDILAPPYTNEDHDEHDVENIPEKEQRHCDFYKIARPMQRSSNSNSVPVGEKQCDEVEKKCYWLQVIPTPSDYNCDFEPYLGPPLVLPS